jgi:hypothetical protein
MRRVSIDGMKRNPPADLRAAIRKPAVSIIPRAREPLYAALPSPQTSYPCTKHGFRYHAPDEAGSHIAG